MHSILVLFTAFSLAFSPSAQAGWDRVGVTSGVTVERKTIPDSALFAFRGEGVFDVPIGLLATVLKDPDIAEEWVDLMTEHTVLRSVGENKNLIYESYGLPWPISDRDYVMTEEYGYDAAAKIFTIDFESVKEPSKPPVPDLVRAMAYRTFWRLTMVDADTTKIEVEVSTDPKGALPAWLINMIQKDWPWKTVDGLVKRASKGDIQADPGVAGW
jgi:hypothetical protein